MFDIAGDGMLDLLIERSGENGVHVPPFNIPVQIEWVAALKPRAVAVKAESLR